jgi:hypothetical protein
MECVALGDSIAVGISQFSNCKKVAVVGYSSKKILVLSKNINSEIVVISVGSNDPHNPKLRSNLIAIRNNVTAKKVIWIVPYDIMAGKVVREVAIMHGDKIVSLTNYKTNDNLHPRNYSELTKGIFK